MIYLFILALAILLWRALCAFGRSRRYVNKITSAVDVWEQCILPWTAHGRNGWRTTIFHVQTGTLIVIAKTLARNYPTAAVRVRVVRSQVESPEKYNPEVLVSKRLRGWFPSIPLRKLPSVDAAIIHEEVDCGASLGKLHTTVVRMISEVAPENTMEGLYVWGDIKGTCPWLVLGAFEP